MGSIYDKLEIKDYTNIFDFMDDMTDRQTLCEDNDIVFVVGDADFIHSVIVYLVTTFSNKDNIYKISDVELYVDGYNGEYVLEIFNDIDNDGIIMLCAEPIRVISNDICDVNCCNNGMQRIKNSIFWLSGYSRVFLNQYHIKQDIVEKALKECDEVMLFGYNENDCGENANGGHENNCMLCDPQCPWFEECCV